MAAVTAVTATRAVGALLLAASTGCVFLIDTVDVEPSCSIEGTSACATCMRTKCQASIDACCASITCSDVDGHSPLLDGLDRCGNGDKAQCTNTLISTKSSFDSSGEAVRTCIKGLCNELCTGNSNP